MMEFHKAFVTATIEYHPEIKDNILGNAILKKYDYRQIIVSILNRQFHGYYIEMKEFIITCLKKFRKGQMMEREITFLVNHRLKDFIDKNGIPRDNALYTGFH